MGHNRLVCSRKTAFFAVVFLVIMVFPAASARAGSILDLKIERGGNVRYGLDSRHGFIRGNEIRMVSLVAGANYLRLIGGRLEFVTGYGLGSMHNFSAGRGGNFSISGCADANHDGRCGSGDIKGTLMTGSFLNSELVLQNGKEILQAELVDQLDPRLAAFLHLPDILYLGRLDLMVAAWGEHSRRFVNDRVLSGSLEDFSQVPEPASIFLLAASLVGAGIKCVLGSKERRVNR